MREDKQETGASVRTWPGIVMLVCIAVVLCAGIYLFAYKSGYLPMPAYLERFFSLRSGTDGTAANGDATGAFFRALPDGTPETTVVTLAPEKSDAKSLFAALVTPSVYEQRIQITEQADESSKPHTRTVTLTVTGEMARVEKSTDRGGSTEAVLYDSARGVCYRDGDANPYPIGQNTPYTEIGLPTLAQIQARNDLTVTFSDANKALIVTFTADDTTWTLTYGVDSGLLTEMQIVRGGVRVSSMFTDQYALYPILDAALFRIPDAK